MLCCAVLHGAAKVPALLDSLPALGCGTACSAANAPYDVCCPCPPACPPARIAAPQALQLQHEQMSRAKAAQTHLLRAMDCFHEGIVLLDLSSNSWQMLYANDAFREASGMPELLAGAGMEPGGGSGAQRPGDAASSLDFWQLFGHVTAGTHGSYNVSGTEQCRPAGLTCCTAGAAGAAAVCHFSAAWCHPPTYFQHRLFMLAGSTAGNGLWQGICHQGAA